MRLADLRAFREVVRQGRATKAAVSLGLWLPTGSGRSGALKQELLQWLGEPLQPLERRQDLAGE